MRRDGGVNQGVGGNGRMNNTEEDREPKKDVKESSIERVREKEIDREG